MLRKILPTVLITTLGLTFIAISYSDSGVWGDSDRRNGHGGDSI